MVRHSALVVNPFQVKGSGRTPYRSLRGKDYTGEVVTFGEVFGFLFIVDSSLFVPKTRPTLA